MDEDECDRIAKAIAATLPPGATIYIVNHTIEYPPDSCMVVEEVTQFNNQPVLFFQPPEEKK